MPAAVRAEVVTLADQMLPVPGVMTTRRFSGEPLPAAYSHSSMRVARDEYTLKLIEALPEAYAAPSPEALMAAWPDTVRRAVAAGQTRGGISFIAGFQS